MNRIRPQLLFLFQESFERELYVNQRQLSDDMDEHRRRKHRYHYIDDDDRSISAYDPTFTEEIKYFMNSSFISQIHS